MKDIDKGRVGGMMGWQGRGKREGPLWSSGLGDRLQAEAEP